MANSTATLTLTDFLLARIAEDEDLWLLAERAELAFTVKTTFAAVPPRDFALRMLADCKAKRRIVARCSWAVENDYGDDMALQDQWSEALDTLGDLAAVYAKHPDYRQDWAPTTA